MPKAGLRIAHLNVNSLRHKLDHVSKLLYDNRIDALGVSETKLSEDMDDSELGISNYQFFRKDRNEFGGGVAFYVSTRLHARRF